MGPVPGLGNHLAADCPVPLTPWLRPQDTATTWQLAALRRQQVVFEASLGTAREWLLEYVDQGEPVVTQAVSEIDGLLEVQLDQPLPDISASLSALVASHQDTP